MYQPTWPCICQIWAPNDAPTSFLMTTKDHPQHAMLTFECKLVKEFEAKDLDEARATWKRYNEEADDGECRT